MPNRIVSTAKGTLASLVLLANVLIVFSAFIPVSIIKLALPFKPVRKLTDATLNGLAQAWVSVNNTWVALVGNRAWQIEMEPQLKSRGWYLVSANHQSWVDILVLQRVFNGLNGRLPLLKFFIKRELIYVPIMGLAWWALDFPFMRRSGGRAAAKDLEAARAACEKFRLIPTSVISFMEGTRFSLQKKQAQGSPYRHLLKPKTGGIAMALATMGDRFDSLLDVTIVYPGGIPTFWDLLAGRVRDVVVRVREVAIPADLREARPITDKDYKSRLQGWVNEMWAEKDRCIDDLLARRSAQAA